MILKTRVTQGVVHGPRWPAWVKQPCWCHHGIESGGNRGHQQNKAWRAELTAAEQRWSIAEDISL